ncbi:S49 family peptidase [Uliginosibacterium sp. sgz301328]|uniref:S49 family peptidase n=1 Tax=Uliginosibacterium sp. sgz301328 TaxID=3243764 RepID=UPI00359DF9B0
MSDLNEPGWERKLLEKLAFENLKETRRRRRWGVFFKLVGFAYVGFILFLTWAWQNGTDSVSDGAAHTAMVEMNGAIGVGDAVNAEQVNLALQSAFEDAGTKGVILRINSPGGSPVQAGMINDEIRRLRAKYKDIPLYAVVEDICASGGYYVAAAADKIFVDKASIVGSIGVRMDGFGFTGAMEKLGVERRLVTAGENKAFLDPFSPQDPKQVQFAHDMLEEIHQQFIDVVRKGRGARLHETPDMFSGLFWTGSKSIELGLADAYGTVDSVARDVIKAEEVRDYTQRENFAERFAKRFGAEVAGGATQALSRVGIK